MRKFRLRSKFLLSLLIVSAGLTAATLAVVSYSVKKSVRQSIREQLRSSITTYNTIEKQRGDALARSAELLANLPNVRALMTTNDLPTIQDEVGNISRLSGSDVLVLADRSGRVVGVRGHDPAFVSSDAQRLLKDSLQSESSADWWYAGGHLYQIRIQPIYFGDPSPQNTVGLLVVGLEVDDQAARDFGSIVSDEIVVRYGGQVVAASLPVFRQASLASAGSGPRGVDEEIQLGRERYLASTVSLSGDAARGVELTVLKSLDQATAFLVRLNHVLIGLGLLSVLAGGALVFFISHTFTRPLSDLVSGVRALELGDYQYPLQSLGGDEVAEVTGAFARMRATLQNTQSEQKQLEERLRQAHKMEAVGRLAGGVAHDFNNLLTIIRGNADILSDRPGADALQGRCVEQIQKASSRAVSMTRQLLAFSRMQVLQPRVLDLNTVVAEMGKMLPRLIGEHIEYSLVPETNLAPVQADPGQIEQVILNLAVNARDAMPGGGKLTVRTLNVTVNDAEAAKRPPMSSGNYVLLSVTDTGHGMDEATKAHIFEPFFTTKEVGQGTGLGLATIYGVVKQSGGFIWVESAPDRGTTFEIYLPQAEKALAATEHEPRRVAAPGGSETILVVEDEAGVRQLASEFLRLGGYAVLEASNGVEALDLAERHTGRIHLVLSDLVMPRMSGKELAARLQAGRREIRIVFMTGYAQFSESGDGVSSENWMILQKPFSKDSLLRAVREVLTGKTLEQASIVKGDRLL
ncbi:MAG: ATP-binding protein [Candidatus Acidiferrales bacterium]